MDYGSTKFNKGHDLWSRASKCQVSSNKKRESTKKHQNMEYKMQSARKILSQIDRYKKARVFDWKLIFYGPPSEKNAYFVCCANRVL